MKKSGLLHPALLAAIGSLGHGDEFLVCDAGMPIPPAVTRIDLAYRAGDPAFLDVLRAIVAEVVVEHVFVANETDPALIFEIETVTGRPAGLIAHDDLKHRSATSRFAVRTGEFTPYANVIIVAGAAF